jgi:hypothetical protein
VTLVEIALAGVSIGEASSFRNLTVFPLVTHDETPAPYLTLDEALALGGIRVTEVSESASVSGLRVVNTLDRPVLLLDGEEIVGAKQNRVFNLTILVPAAAELLVPVSCVEAGRWSHVSDSFMPAPRAQYSAGRSERVAQVSDSLLDSGARSSDQSRVWEHIEAKRLRMGVESPTRAMADIYERFSGSVEEYVQAVTPVDGQAGAVFALNGEVAGMDLFDAGSTLRNLLPKLVRSYALDAIETAQATDVPGPEAASAFLEIVGAAGARSFPAVGLGEDVRVQGDGVSGAALVADGRVVHLCAFRQSGPGAPAARTAMRRASDRREHFER